LDLLKEPKHFPFLVQKETEDLQVVYYQAHLICVQSKVVKDFFKEFEECFSWLLAALQNVIDA
jgi:hypothetical protein